MKQTMRKHLSVLLALVMVLTLLPAVTVTAWAGGPTGDTTGSLAGNVAINNTTPTDTTPTDVPATSDLETPLTLEAKTDGTIVVNNPQSGMEYSINGGTKHAVTTDAINVTAGDTVAFYGTADSYNGTTIRGGSAQCYIYGNIMSLIDATGFANANATALTGAYAFRNFFRENIRLFSHPDRKLVLPATTLTNRCYAYMFSGCTGLTTAPELPATTLANSCYAFMFANCTGLTTAPELPATTLAEDCYLSMFNGCAKLTTAPALSATTLAESCYAGMFSGCAGLTTAPALPATTLAESCYYNMFKDCMGLTTAPALPADTLANMCYASMFSGCTNLNAVTCLATDTGISAKHATMNWLKSVASSGTFTKAPGMTGWQTNSINGIPVGWTVKDYSDGTDVPYLDADGVEQSCATYTDIATDTDVWSGGWYVVKENVTIDNTVTFSGDVHLILCDGAKLTVNIGTENGNAIKSSGSGSLTVYAQSTGADMGALEATAQEGSAILTDGCAVTINGGKVTVTSKSNGIYANTVSISGGSVNATGEIHGILAYSGNVTITGGDVTASATNDGAMAVNSKNGAVVIGPGLRVDAGDDETSAVKVTKTFPETHPQKWAHIYEITQSTYTLTIPAAVTVSGAGWNATGGVGASGELAKGKKLTVTAASGDDFALVCEGKGTIGYYLAATATDTQPTTTWTFTALDDDPATQPMGVIVSETDYNSARPGTYTDTVTFTAQVEDANPLQKLTVPAYVWSDEMEEDVQVDVDFYYMAGETWKQAIENHPTENAGWSTFDDSDDIFTIKGEKYTDVTRGINNFIMYDDNADLVNFDLEIDPTGKYTLVNTEI